MSLEDIIESQSKGLRYWMLRAIGKSDGSQHCDGCDEVMAKDAAMVELVCDLTAARKQLCLACIGQAIELRKGQG